MATKALPAVLACPEHDLLLVGQGVMGDVRPTSFMILASPDLGSGRSMPAACLQFQHDFPHHHRRRGPSIRK
jgi:hypothetical protein